MKKLWWALCALLMAVSMQARAEPAYGKNLVRAQDLSADTIARFVRVNEAKAINAKPNADDEREWIGDPVPVTTSGNPYTLVVRISGTATGEGEVTASWSGGWSLDGAARLFPMFGSPKSGVIAGERVTMVAVSMPVSFKEDRTMSPALGFVATKNIRMDRVQFEVWSGAGDTTAVETLWTWAPLLLGLAVLGLSFWLRRS